MQMNSNGIFLAFLMPGFFLILVIFFYNVYSIGMINLQLQDYFFDNDWLFRVDKTVEDIQDLHVLDRYIELKGIKGNFD